MHPQYIYRLYSYAPVTPHPDELQTHSKHWQCDFTGWTLMNSRGLLVIIGGKHVCEI